MRLLMFTLLPSLIFPKCDWFPGSGSGDAGADTNNVPFTVTSSAFSEGATIPTQYTCTLLGGQDISPPLAWTAGPTGTQSYAVVMRDLDFGFIHWVIWDIPGSVLGLPENVAHTYQPPVPAGAKQAALNSTLTGYAGPCSPSTVNTYEFRVYALPTASIPGLDATSTPQQAEQAVVGAALGSTALSGES